jgi:hypothetical protein
MYYRLRAASTSDNFLVRGHMPMNITKLNAATIDTKIIRDDIGGW